MIKLIIFDLACVYFTSGTKIASERISKKYNFNAESVRQVLEKTGDKPEDAVFVDDKEEYVETAKKIKEYLEEE